jgi:hypothetical protein
LVTFSGVYRSCTARQIAGQKLEQCARLCLWHSSRNASEAQATCRDWAKPLAFFRFSGVLFRGGGFNITRAKARDGRVRAGKERGPQIHRDGNAGRGSTIKMRFSWAAAVLVAGLGVSGWAQQAPYKIKPSHEDKPAKSSAPIGKTAGVASASAENANSLQNIEHQSARASTSSSSRAAGKKSAALKPIKDKPNPPMNFGTSSGVKGGGKPTQGSNPYKGRVRQKGAHN